MPLVSIDLLRGHSKSQLDAIAACVQAAIVEVLGVAERNRFCLVTEHEPGALEFDRGYLDGDREDGFVLIRIVLAAGRSLETKRKFYVRVAGLLADRTEVRREDVMIVLIENSREDWSYGRGAVDYVDKPQEEWR
jgi:phenylpyruvate tautomerase PptA (4-oxalocrotonate tautomerase family)